jgi:hypothetical protein
VFLVFFDDRPGESAQRHATPARVVDDYAMDQVLIGPDDFAASQVALVDTETRPTTSGVVDAIAIAPARSLARTLRKTALKVLSWMPLDRAEGDALLALAVNEPLHPTRAQLDRYFADDPKKPPYMLNLLKYRNRVEYARYGLVALRYVLQSGGDVVWTARSLDPEWDEIALVRYPSREAFRYMATRRAYQQAERAHRQSGLAKTRLFVLSPRGRDTSTSFAG